MTTQEQHRSDKEGQQQGGDRSKDGITGKNKKTKGQDGTLRDENEAREEIAEMRREMAQSQTGFTGD